MASGFNFLGGLLISSWAHLIRAFRCKGTGELQSVALRILIQAAGIDDLVKQLQGMGKDIGASAYMRQAAS